MAHESYINQRKLVYSNIVCEGSSVFILHTPCLHAFTTSCKWTWSSILMKHILLVGWSYGRPTGRLWPILKWWRSEVGLIYSCCQESLVNLSIFQFLKPHFILFYLLLMHWFANHLVVAFISYLFLSCLFLQYCTMAPKKQLSTFQQWALMIVSYRSKLWKISRPQELQASTARIVVSVAVPLSLRQ